LTFDPGWNQNDKLTERHITQSKPTADGVWIIRKHILGSVISIHQTEIEALRAVNENGLGKAEFCPWGKILVDLSKSSDSSERIDV
jgi:hypothetical protein